MVTEECLKKGTGGNKLTDLIIKDLFIYENQTKQKQLLLSKIKKFKIREP